MFSDENYKPESVNMGYSIIFSGRYRKENIEKAKQLLEPEAENKKEEDLEDGNTVWEKQDTVKLKVTSP